MNRIEFRNEKIAYLDTSSPKIGTRQIVIDSEDLARLDGRKVFAHLTSPGEITEKIRVKQEDGTHKDTTFARFLMNVRAGERVRKAGQDNDYRKEMLNVVPKFSEHYGVTPTKLGKFGFRVYHLGTQITGGPFATAEEAARAFDFKSLELKGKGAKRLNFEDSPKRYLEWQKGRRKAEVGREDAMAHQLVTLSMAVTLGGMTEEQILASVASGSVRISYDDLKVEVT